MHEGVVKLAKEYEEEKGVDNFDNDIRTVKVKAVQQM